MYILTVKTRVRSIRRGREVKNVGLMVSPLLPPSLPITPPPLSPPLSLSDCEYNLTCFFCYLLFSRISAAAFCVRASLVADSSKPLFCFHLSYLASSTLVYLARGSGVKHCRWGIFTIGSWRTSCTCHRLRWSPSNQTSQSIIVSN